MHLFIQSILIIGFGLVAAFSSSCRSGKTTRTAQTLTETSIVTLSKPKSKKVTAEPKANAYPATPPTNSQTNEYPNQNPLPLSRRAVVKIVPQSSTQSTFSDAKNNQKAREAFVTSVIKHKSELSSDVDLGDYGGGVSLVVLAKNVNKEMCVVLGEERGGPYSGKLNFIGGKIDTAQGIPEVKPEVKLVETLYDEVREELGIHLAYDAFKAGLICIKRPNNKKFRTMLCFCYLFGIDTNKWNDMYQKRKNKKIIDWKYIEMSRIAYIPIVELAAFKANLSDYVNENIELIKDAAAEAINRTPPSIKDLPKVQDDVPMLLD